MTHDLHYERGTATPKQIEAYAREIWEEASATGEIPPEVLGDGSFPFEVGLSGSGIVVSGTAIVIGLTSTQLGAVAKKVALDVWKDILLPKLKRRFGEDKIGKQRRAASRGHTAENDQPKKKASGKAARPETAGE